MTIFVNTKSKLHWNYFIALERDLEVMSRYIEFSEPNIEVYSIELARLLFAAASEVDDVAKLLCHRLDPSARRKNIDDYRNILAPAMPELPNTTVYVPRYGLNFNPWLEWSGSSNPVWWKSYNDVKHERNIYFYKANLKNALNALGALLILNFHFYDEEQTDFPIMTDAKKRTMASLLPESSLLRLDPSYYYSVLVEG